MKTKPKLWAGLLLGGTTKQFKQWYAKVSPYVDGILVVQSGTRVHDLELECQDITLPMRQIWVRGVHQHPVTGIFNYGLMRNYILSLADKNDLVLMLDLDESIEADYAAYMQWKDTATEANYTVRLLSQHRGLDGELFDAITESRRIVKVDTGNYQFHVHERFKTDYNTHFNTTMMINHTGYNIPVEQIIQKAATYLKGLEYEVMQTSDVNELKYLHHHITNMKAFIPKQFLNI